MLDLVEYVNHPDRLLYPMKRAHEDRGKDKWERITWDEAWDIIVTNVTEIKEKWGARSIVVHGGTGREAVMYGYPLCFAALQSPELLQLEVRLGVLRPSLHRGRLHPRCGLSRD